MNDQNSKPEPFELSFWMNGLENTKLGKAAYKWFSMLGRAAFWVASSRDPMTCSERILDELAWERGIQRYEGEPLRLYRLRVKYAYANGKDAGLVNGFKRIFKRLELIQDEGDIIQHERMDGVDWDVIGLEMDDTAFPDSQDVLEIIIDAYGRTCRRYRFISRITQPVFVTVGIFDEDHNTVYAEWGEEEAVAVSFGVGVFDNDQNTVEAEWQQ